MAPGSVIPTEVEESLDIWFVSFIGKIIGDVSTSLDMTKSGSRACPHNLFG